MWLSRTTLSVVIGLGIVLAGASISNAYVITFDDQAANTYYFPGQSFASNGTTVALTDFQFASGAIWPANVARIVTAAPYGLIGNALALTGTVAGAVLPNPVSLISLQYAAIDNTEGILVVNGQELRFSTSPVQLNGQSVGGALVFVTAGPVPMAGLNMGTLSLSGNITSVQLGGQNVMLDAIQVPEPATLALLSLGGLLIARKRK